MSRLVNNLKNSNRYLPYFAFVPACILALAVGAANNLPSVDLPNHLVRYQIIASLIFDASSQFVGEYGIDLIVSPYILWDLVAAGLVQLLGATATAKILNILVLLSLGAGGYFYARAIQRTRGESLVATLFCLYIASGWFFTIGYISYMIGMGYCLGALGCWHIAVRPSEVHLRKQILFSLMVVFAYLTHLSAFVFIGFYVLIDTIVDFYCGRRNWKPRVIPTCVLGMVSIFHLLASKNSSSWYLYQPLTTKIQRIIKPLLRFDDSYDLLFLWLFAATLMVFLLLAIGHKRFKGIEWDFKMLARFSSFFLLFLSLPIGLISAWDVDIRVLPLVYVFAVLSFRIPEGKWTKAVAAFMFIFSTASALHFGKNILAMDTSISQYHKVLAEIPPNSTVLPVRTRGDEKLYSPWSHQNTLYVITTGGKVPYLFSRDRGNPIYHFRDYNVLPAPSEVWYIRNNKEELQKYIDNYDYLIANDPLEVSASIQERLEVVRSNEQGVLYLIKKKKVPTK